MRPFPMLLAGFVAVPVVEIALFIVVGRRIGVLATVGIVLLTALIGASLVSRQGRGAIEAVRAELVAGRFPGQQLAHGAMIMVAGALLLTPGFLTDAIGFSLMVPAVRESLRRWAVRRYGRTITP